MKRKAIFIGPAYPYRGGISAFNENLAATFQANDWDCKMVTFIQQYPNFLFPGKNQYVKDTQPPDLNITRGIYSTNPLNWYRISKEIVKEKPDVVITQYWMPFMAPAFGTILRGIKKALPDTKCITLVHNFKPHEPRIGDQQLNRYLVNRSDVLLCLSSKVAKDIKEATDQKVVELFHPVYDHYGAAVTKIEAQESLGLDPSVVHLLFFGLVRKYKGLDLLLKAIPLVQHDKKFKVIIAGEFYDNEKKYLELIEDGGCKDKVIIKNEYIADHEVPQYFCAADLIVLPYKRATQSGVIPIALHFEKPVLVSDVGGLSQLIRDFEIGALVQPTPVSIANQIEDFLENGSPGQPDFKGIRKALSWQTFYEAIRSEL